MTLPLPPVRCGGGDDVVCVEPCVEEGVEETDRACEMVCDEPYDVLPDDDCVVACECACLLG